MGNYYCEYCGHKFSSVATMMNSSCFRNPTGGRNHKLYEGSEKSKYTCKYCGREFPSLETMANCNCIRNPHGKNHSPAL